MTFLFFSPVSFDKIFELYVLGVKLLTPCSVMGVYTMIVTDEGFCPLPVLYRGMVSDEIDSPITTAQEQRDILVKEKN